MKNMKKILVLALAALLLVAVSVAGTVAYLTATTTPVTNTFTPTTLSVDVKEDNLQATSKTIEMIPGTSVAKDPKVTYSTDIPAYVFVKVTESIGAGLTFSDYIGYSVITSGEKKWNALDSAPDVYYMEVTKGSNPEGGISVIQDSKGTADKVTIKESVDLTAMKKLLNVNGEIDDTKCPKLTFEAFIIQKEPFGSAAAAWNELTTPSSGT